MTLKDALFAAWNRTESCPDGVYDGNRFCPDCLYKSLWLVLEESAKTTETDYKLRLVQDGE